MNPLRTIRMALRALARNAMRSLLTALGIIVGVACVVAVMGIGEGARRQSQDSLRALGTNFLMVMPGARTSSGARSGWGSSSKLSEDDVEAIRAEVRSVAYVTPSNRTTAQIAFGNQNWSTSVQGAEVDWPLIRAWNVAVGAFFSETDQKSAMKVCVLGATVAEQLFGAEDPVGKVVRINKLPFRVTGVLDRKGGSLMGQDQDDVVIAPYQTVKKRLQRSQSVGMILASAVSDDHVSQAEAEITALLRQRHRLGPMEPDDFGIRLQTEMLEQAAEQSRTMIILLWSIAGVSLLVGGIGIMNIMLVSVTERTREIGVRMAIGARGSDIRAQFLVEATVLSLLGGSAGIGLGIGIQRLVARFAGWPVTLDPLAIGLAFGFSALVGVAFGFWPALKASRLDPIQALRYE